MQSLLRPKIHLVSPHQTLSLSRAHSMVHVWLLPAAAHVAILSQTPNSGKANPEGGVGDASSFPSFFRGLLDMSTYDRQLACQRPSGRLKVNTVLCVEFLN